MLGRAPLRNISMAEVDGKGMKALAPLPVLVPVLTSPGRPADGTVAASTKGAPPPAILSGSQSFGAHLRMSKESSASGSHGATPLPSGMPATPPPLPVPETDAPVVTASVTVEELWPVLVRRAAWSGDACRGTVRLELGAGALAGATVLVHSEAGRVSVQLSAPPGVDLDGWRARIAQRLAARGLDVDGVDVD